MQLKVLDLFSGLGGFSLGLERTGCFKTIAFCEIDKYCNLILNKHWKGIKVYGDVRTLTKKQFEEDGIEFPDVITGGFPCQPFSVAGKQKGTNDDRHLWPEMFRVIQEFKPTFVIGENVKNIINIQDGVVFETVCTDLESEGYEVQTYNIPACAVDAPHRRERIWIVGYSQHNGSLASKITRGINQTSNDDEKRKNETSELTRASGSGNIETMENSGRTLRQRTEFERTNENEIKKEDANQPERSSGSSGYDVANSDTRFSNRSREEIQTGRNSVDTSSENVPDTNNERSQGHRIEYELSESKGQEQISWPRRWEFEPNVGRVAHGVSGRVHRLRGLGNSIVPQIAEEIGKAIIGVYHGNR